MLNVINLGKMKSVKIVCNESATNKVSIVELINEAKCFIGKIGTHVTSKAKYIVSNNIIVVL